MKACEKCKKGIYYNLSQWNRRIKIKRVTFVSVLALCFLMSSILVAHGGPNKVSRTITTSLYVMPKAELVVDRAKIEGNPFLLDSKTLLNDLSRDNDDVRVNRIFRGGQEIVVITKVCEEVLY